MNNARRKEVAKIIEEAGALQERMTALMEEEQEYFDAMPEGIQQSEKGEMAEQSLYCFENANEAFEEVVSQLEEATQ